MNEEKYDLLDEVVPIVRDDINLPGSLLLLVLGIFIVAVLLFAPKIYIQNNIYYESRELNRLYNQYISLKEENINLKQQLEAKKYQNQILDSDVL
jgi:cell division protein FtsL